MQVRACITKFDTTAKKISIGLEFDFNMTAEQAVYLFEATRTGKIQIITIEEEPQQQDTE